MRRCTKKTCRLKVGRYAARLIDLNEYLDSFPGEAMSGKTDVIELNEIPKNSMPNICYKQAYVQGFDCESILFKNT